MARRGNNLLLWGGAAVAIGVLSVGAYLAFASPSGPGQIQLSVQPTEVNEGSGFPVTAQGTYMMNGQPSQGTIYMRLRHPAGTFETLNQKFGPQFSETISTSGREAGDYAVEASDSPLFI